MDTNIFHNAVKNLSSGKEWRCLEIPDTEKYFYDHFEIVSIDQNRQAQYSNDRDDFGFTWKELVTEANRLEAEQSANQYQRDRNYPSIGDQLDMQYWDQVNGTNRWKDAIAKVKADHPKPE